ncbi:MAG: hypothetical protein RMK74_12520 [Myxococcales bacterium]|nr:hypothetical protein [Myxococcales bacterium]
MPLPTVLCLAFATGVATALAGRVELRVSPRPALLTRSFFAYGVYLAGSLVPISVYFYVFHGDWFLLYLADTRRIPSALALLGFVAQAAIGAAGFVMGASLVRAQRLAAAAALSGGLFLLGIALPLLARGRLGVVGSYAQFHGRFGLEPWGTGSLLQGTVVTSALLLGSTAHLLWRLDAAGRRV